MPLAATAFKCDKCQGTMRMEIDVDLHAGLQIPIFVCFNCGRRKPAQKEPRPITSKL